MEHCLGKEQGQASYQLETQVHILVVPEYKERQNCQARDGVESISPKLKENIKIMLLKMFLLQESYGIIQDSARGKFIKLKGSILRYQSPQKKRSWNPSPGDSPTRNKRSSQWGEKQSFATIWKLCSG